MFKYNIGDEVFVLSKRKIIKDIINYREYIEHARHLVKEPYPCIFIKYDLEQSGDGYSENDLYSTKAALLEALAKEAE